MRLIDGSVIAALQSSEIRMFHLLHLDIDGTDYYITDCDVPLVWDGNSYSPRGFSLENIQYSTGHIVDKVTLVLDNLDDLFTSPFVGGTPKSSPVIIRRVLLDSDYAIIAADRTGPVGRWEFDEGFGTTALDTSGNENHGTLYNMGDSNWVSGPKGKALDFDGVEEYVSCGNPSELQITGSLSIAIRVYNRDTTTDGGGLFAKDNGHSWLNTDYGFVRTDTDSVGYCEDKYCEDKYVSEHYAIIHFVISDGASYVQVYATTTQDVWEHWVGVFDATAETISLYRDNVLVAGPTACTLTPKTTGTLYIGGDWDSVGDNPFFNGKLDEALIYDRALSSDEVTALYSHYYAGVGAFTLFDGILDRWTMEEGEIKTVITNILTAWTQKTLARDSSSCRWKKFKGTECGYSGAESWCDRTYERCKDLGNTANFGGNRWLASLVGKEIWWGRTPG